PVTGWRHLRNLLEVGKPLENVPDWLGYAGSTRESEPTALESEAEPRIIPQAWNFLDGLNQPRELQPNPWLFDGVLSKAGGGVIVMDSGEGKTWIQLEIGICTVTGRPLFGRFPNRRRGPVLLLLEEDDKNNALDRGEQLIRSMGLTAEERECLKHLHIVN